MNCTEKSYGYITKVELVPMSAATFAIPMQVVKNTISTEQLTVNEELVAKLLHSTGSAQLTDSLTNDKAAAYHTCRLTYSLDADDTDMMAQLQSMLSTPYHLRVTYQYGQKVIVRCLKESYSITYSQDEEQTVKAEIQILNSSGIQTIL